MRDVSCLQLLLCNPEVPSGVLDLGVPFLRREVTKGMETMRKMEHVETTKSGIFVMPKERITITGTYWYRTSEPGGSMLPLNSKVDSDLAQRYAKLEQELVELKRRHAAQGEELERVRRRCLP